MGKMFNFYLKEISRKRSNYFYTTELLNNINQNPLIFLFTNDNSTSRTRFGQPVLLELYIGYRVKKYHNNNNQ